MITKGACESFDKGMGLVTDLVFTLAKLINIGHGGEGHGCCMVEKLGPARGS
jgi:hypothetical protein